MRETAPQRKQLDVQVQHDAPSEYLHCNWNALLPQEVRLWMNGTRMTLNREEVKQCLAFLQAVLAKMEPTPAPVAHHNGWCECAECRIQL